MIVSPSVKEFSFLFVPPDLLYLTYKVSGSTPSVATTSIIVATTPELVPVITVPTLNCAKVFVLSILESLTAY